MPSLTRLVKCFPYASLMRLGFLSWLVVGAPMSHGGAAAVRAEEPSAARRPATPAVAWPHWRGTAGDGSARHADPPIEWSETRNVAWRLELPGEGSGTPIVWGDLVVLQAAVKTDRMGQGAEPHPETKTPTPQHIYQYVVLAVDRHTGSKAWQTVVAEAVPHEGRHPTNTFASASLTTDGDRLYASFGSQGVYCLTMKGEKVWERDLGRMRTRYGWGEGASPLLHGERLIVPWDQEEQSRLFVLDTRTGKTVWEAERDEPTSWATPLVVEFAGRNQLILNGTNRVRSYDLESGEVIWECGGQTVNAIPTPVRFGDAVICMSGYRGSYAVAIPLDSRGDVTDSPTLRWKHQGGTPYVPSPLLYKGQIYFTSSNRAILTCLDAGSGEVVFGPVRLPKLDSLYASPVAAADRIYFVGRNGGGLVLQHDTELNVLAENQLEDSFDASPVVVDNQLLLRGRTYLYCIENMK